MEGEQKRALNKEEKRAAIIRKMADAGCSRKEVMEALGVVKDDFTEDDEDIFREAHSNYCARIRTMLFVKASEGNKDAMNHLVRLNLTR